ncbi:hypothetical protein CBR_g20209 [Chara braunii]|uniref:Uncharacterized protein n=1 Tax=Chara braunii TaxID=69332 RepID=A0A388KZY7_CHABU|nr:hypothetical protein CBR_g20209 [Chara braunii]|eukprot:GBG75578.1 hypothetical protein CBR_g20209 [Chara braunii]
MELPLLRGARGDFSSRSRSQEGTVAPTNKQNSKQQNANGVKAGAQAQQDDQDCNQQVLLRSRWAAAWPGTRAKTLTTTPGASEGEAGSSQRSQAATQFERGRNDTGPRSTTLEMCKTRGKEEEEGEEDPLEEEEEGEEDPLEEEEDGAQEEEEEEAKQEERGEEEEEQVGEGDEEEEEEEEEEEDEEEKEPQEEEEEEAEEEQEEEKDDEEEEEEAEEEEEEEDCLLYTSRCV